MSEKLNFSSILDRAFTILGRNLPGALLLALVVVGLPGMYLQTQFLMLGEVPTNAASFLLAALFAAVGQAILVGTLLYAVLRHMLGLGSASIGVLYTYGIKISVPGVLVALAVALIIGFGFALAALPGIPIMRALSVIPALYVTVLFYVAVPAAVAEQLPVVAALRRSIQLTEGYRWVLLAFQIIVLIVSGLLGWVAELLFRPLGISAVAGVVIASLAAALTSIMVGLIYHDLRVMKDGATAEDMVSALK